MGWVWLVIAGGIGNVTSNFIYKLASGKANALILASGAMILGGLALLGYIYGTNKDSIKLSFNYESLIFICLLALIGVFVNITFIRALASGPISLINPVWCAVVNVGVLGLGLLVLKEQISLVALGGVVLSTLGILMMAKG